MKRKVLTNVSERVCIFAGSFDPVTNGHMDVIRRASALFDRVYVAVLINCNKKGWLSVGQRTELLRIACAGMQKVEVGSYDGMVKDLAREKNAVCLIRGSRTGTEFETECTTAELNRHLLPGLETIILPATPGLAAVSSSAVREILSFGGDISGLVPDSILPALIRANLQC